MIICGFPGTGKSTMAKHSNWVDLESTPFQKNWLLYAEVAKHMSDNGYTVMVSTHAEMLDALEQLEVSYTVVIPPLCDKADYINRYVMRGNSYEFIENLKANWKNWLHDIIVHNSVLRTVVILAKDGCIAEWAKDMRGEQECSMLLSISPPSNSLTGFHAVDVKGDVINGKIQRPYRNEI